MPYDELLKSRRIRRERVSPREAERGLRRAERDLKAARAMMAQDWDWAFAIAYDAVFQASRAYMFARGYRPASKEAHKNTFAFLREAMGQGAATLIAYFDRIRRKRHKAIYDVAGLISETEARALFKSADAFVRRIAADVRQRLAAKS
ncbi:MAG: HEPN domain-containing protein [Planctomycetes bacterium]|nr:HEPN domain-containing protein [Planctomycetota bacterium]